MKSTVHFANNKQQQQQKVTNEKKKELKIFVKLMLGTMEYA